MFSARSLFQEIVDNDDSFRLFCSIAASGEAQGGWENGRIAALMPASMRELAPKVTRHGADEDKHGRIFHALLRKRGLTPTDVPGETDYTALLERQGIGLAHDKLRRDEPLTELDIITYLAHSRVTEQRAVRPDGDAQQALRPPPRGGQGDQDDLPRRGQPPRVLPRGAAAAGPPRPRPGHPADPARSAHAEIVVYRDVSLAVMDHMGRILKWPTAKSGALTAGIRAMYGYERLGGWRRMVSLRMPERRDPLGGPATSAPEFA